MWVPGGGDAAQLDADGWAEDGQGTDAGAGAPVRQAFRGLVRQPYVQILNDMTDVEAVEAAAAEGRLPRIVARGMCLGVGEWVEFERPARGQGQGGQAHGGSGAAAGAAGAAAGVAAAAAAGCAGDGVQGAEGAGGSCSAAVEEDGPVEDRPEDRMWPVAWFRYGTWA